MNHWVRAQATLLMDVHAHLSGSEVIGLLGGTWEPQSRRIHVARAFPCRRAPGTHSGTSVELDPAAEVETRALMQAHSLTPVGWWGTRNMAMSGQRILVHLLLAHLFPRDILRLWHLAQAYT